MGQHGFNLLQNVDINGVDFGLAFTPVAQDPTLAASPTPGVPRSRSICFARIKGSARFSRTGESATTPTTPFRRRSIDRFRNGLAGGLNYTLGLSNTGTAGNPVRLQHNADGSYVIRADQAEADELLKDLGLQRHIIKGNLVWDLPDMSYTGGVRRVIAAVVNDWQLSGILTAGTGAPYTRRIQLCGRSGRQRARRRERERHR